MSDVEVNNETESVCDCEKHDCKICAAALDSDECACCAHGCSCCGDQTSEMMCECEDDCGCSGENCNCKHGPCDSETCTCACGCGGHGNEHVCPVCGMAISGDSECACVLHHHEHRRRHHHGHNPHHGHDHPSSRGCNGGCGRSQGCGEHHRTFHRNPPAAVLVGLGLLGAVDLALKTIAIRRAVKLDDKEWVLPLAVVNTVGLLPAYYLRTHPKKQVDDTGVGVR